MSLSKGLRDDLTLPQLDPGPHLVLFNQTCSILDPGNLLVII